VGLVHVLVRLIGPAFDVFDPFDVVVVVVAVVAPFDAAFDVGFDDFDAAVFFEF